jgi:polysaccharide deacetylase 2 family uncharacterized protein YibQ
VVDDLGHGLAEGRRVVRLPGPVACAILPHTPFGAQLAVEAHRRNKEVILHLPMESSGNGEAGPGRLETDMPARELAMTFAYDLETVPHAVGVNNHMGSRLTQEAPPMRALMQAIARRGNLFFLDSLTHPRSLAAQAAAEAGVPYLTRQVFLDNERTPEAIARRLEELARIARRRGAALAIGHPHPETLAALESWIPTLPARGIQLISLSAMLTLHPPEAVHGKRARPAGPGL